MGSAHNVKEVTDLLSMENVADEDWENNWKQFYKPMEIGERLLNFVLEIAGGRQTKNEQHNAREISILKDGVVL